MQELLANPWIWLAVLWSLPWKGLALWRAAQKRHKGWFIAIFLLNTLAILEIIYLFGVIRDHRERAGGHENNNAEQVD